MDAPSVDIKKVALDLAEENARILIEKVVKPYAEFYIAQLKVGGVDVGMILLPFVAKLEAELMKVVDKIDGEVG